MTIGKLLEQAAGASIEYLEGLGARLAVNALDSHSGYNVLRAMLARLAGARPS